MEQEESINAPNLKVDTHDAAKAEDSSLKEKDKLEVERVDNSELNKSVTVNDDEEPCEAMDVPEKSDSNLNNTESIDAIKSTDETDSKPVQEDPSIPQPETELKDEKEAEAATSVDENMDIEEPAPAPEYSEDSEKNTEETVDVSSEVDEVEKPEGQEDGSTSENNELDESLDKNSGNANDNENVNEKTEFVQVNSEKDDNEKDMNKADEMEEDPIGGGDENDSENIESIGEGADEELCIIPDTERVLSQEEKDAACNLAPMTEKVPENEETTQTSETTVTVGKYKEQEAKNCRQCDVSRVPKYELEKEDNIFHICNDECLEEFKKSENGKVVLNWATDIRVKDLAPKILRRTCASCKATIYDEGPNLVWEIMDFCNSICLSKYQKDFGSKCATCTENVKSNLLGKYCVRFGNDIRQFCSSSCLESYKKGLKVCSYCQLDISAEGVLGVGEKGQIKDFCSQVCMDKYDTMINNKPPKVDEGTKCCVCMLSKPITLSYEHDETTNYFCGEPCFVAFSFVNNIKSDKCAMCRRNFPVEKLEENTMFLDSAHKSFCSNSCKNIYIIAQRKIVPCTWCKVKKYNYDMIKKAGKNDEHLNMCSVNCLNLYQVSLHAVSSKKITCDFCSKNLQAMYHLTMSDSTLRNFCSSVCVTSFQNQFKKTPIQVDEEKFPVPTGGPRRSKKIRTDEPSALPVITNVQSLAPNGNGSRSPNSSDTPIQVKHHIIVKNAPVPNQRNVATMCRTRMSNKGSNAVPKVENAQIQTENEGMNKILVPIPVPIFIPLPMHMFAAPVPTPVPIPIPVPVPIFIPTTRNSANGIMKEIKKIQVKIPTNPYEAELLMMAEMVADDKKEENTDSESDVEDTGVDDTGGGGFSPEPQDGSNTFGDDMLQMALKMATELDEPAVDLEGALTANTITASQTQEEVHSEASEEVQPEQLHLMDRGRGRKRSMRGSTRGQGVSKRGRRSLSQHVELPPMMQQPPPPPEPQEKPDANMCLKYTFGVNAWKQWVTFKNAELEKSSRRVKLFKTEILQLTADELNYSLCLFVKEVRKPNGAEYAPDTIYYLCLGIQQYLFENGRIDNIFCDPYYEKFTDCLDEVAKRFSVLYNDSHYIVTRVEEEHLWESKQLGAHSPHVLLSTLMFFNTKHFNLTTVDEHMQLSFSHIMKHWKRNPNQAGASKIPGSRNVLLRFYPPASAIQNTRKKKVYEQQENEENPLRCPVKLYEFYLSKCPESVKTRNDVFYLQPERSCVPDSPVWYSTMPLPKEALEKMLHRVKMVKEINVALLTS